MPKPQTYFFCGIGGSGMMPLAVFLAQRGARVIGSDRSYDQGRTPEKFDALKAKGIDIYPQDGTAMSDDVSRLVVSSAVEASIPDVKVALELDIPIIKRGALLAELFNDAPLGVAVAGTSGKSTVTGMIATIFDVLGEGPSVVNGGQISNFKQNQNDIFSGVRKGQGDAFVAEMDESDASIEHYNPHIAALNNIALDHMTMEELEQLFGDYLARTKTAVVLNYDQPRVRSLAHRASCNILSYAIDNDADIRAQNLLPKQDGIDFDFVYDDGTYSVHLNIAGRHNVENAMAAMACCIAAGLQVDDVVRAISSFTGIHRRMEYIGTANGITVFDDFGHNPDKIGASLQTLKSFDGRILVMFQPHGFGPLRMMGDEMVASFARYMDAHDILMMPEVYYAGGTVDRSVTAKDIIERAKDVKLNAHWFETRAEIKPFIVDHVKKGDRVVIMGARDDTLHTFAHDVLKAIS